MEKVDSAILELLVDDCRLSFAEIGRRVGISRAYARERVRHLVDEGVIEKFTAVVDPVKLGRSVSSFLDVRISPTHIEDFCTELANTPEVISLYLMSDMQSLHIHTLTDSEAHLDAFVREHFFARDGVLSIDCKMLLRRIKNRRGGPRL